MPFSLRLDDARNDLTYIAGIDGKTGASGRHSPTRLNALLNRKYRNLRSRVSQLGYPQFLKPGTVTTLPGRASGEDYQEITLPSATEELAGVDVQVNGEWLPLDPIEFEQRRDGIVPPRGVGYWSIIQALEPSTTSITAGKIAVWPAALAGNYKLQYVQGWTDITTDAHVFMLFEAWDDWLLNAAALVCCSRDKKDGNYATIERDFNRADALVEASAARFQRGGSSEPTPYRGICL